MSETYSKIKSEVIVAMKAKDSNRLLVLRSLDSAIKNIAIKEGHRDGPTEEDTLQGLSQAVKRGSDSAEQFRVAGREDLVETELYQVQVAKSFLPTQMEKAEFIIHVAEDIQDYIALNGAVTTKDFGKFMKLLGEKYRGKVDNKTLSECIICLVRTILIHGLIFVQTPNQVQ